ncbi:MAG TPA: molybdenum cofactor biosynthesis protein MoaE [Bacteroidetes bacterium]|nr:molybdenum cofactor biosynthesis protein MoaE [Bacteroidota bacterium]HRR09153.1 molybdenum cofactor biosynthesis protein MoaE [Rhodothermales bacterium]
MHFGNPLSDTWIGISDEEIPAERALYFLTHRDAGGMTLFLGTTRRMTGERETKHLTYEAYLPMALSEMGRLATEARKQWPILHMVLLHRIGLVPITEISVLIGVSTPHRDAAFLANRWLIDNLKADVPIWKQETYSDGSVEWVKQKG